MTAHRALWAALALLFISAAGAAPATEAGYSAAALYNAGNGYARNQKPGLAVLHYERALLLDPGDDDALANLRFVRESLHLAPAPFSTLERVARLGSPTSFAWIGVAGLGLAGAALLLMARYRRHRLLLGAVFLVGAIDVAAAGAQGLLLWPLVHSGVVISPAAPVRGSPVSIGEPTFSLREAELVRIEAMRGEFVLIRDRTGRVGWAPRVNVEPIIP